MHDDDNCRMSSFNRLHIIDNPIPGIIVALDITLFMGEWVGGKGGGEGITKIIRHIALFTGWGVHTILHHMECDGLKHLYCMIVQDSWTAESYF